MPGRWSRQDLVLVVPPDHPLAGRKSIDLEETLSYPYVSFSRGSGMRDTVDALFGQLQARPRISCETEEMEVVAVWPPGASASRWSPGWTCWTSCP